MTRSYRFLVLLGFLLGSGYIYGCAAGQIGQLPTIQNPADASEIYIIRGKANFAELRVFYVAIDNHDVFGITVGHYTSFCLPPGRHSISVKLGGGIITGGLEDEQELMVVQKGKYYLLIDAYDGGINIKSINESLGYKYISNYVYLPLIQR